MLTSVEYVRDMTGGMTQILCIPIGVHFRRIQSYFFRLPVVPPQVMCSTLT